MSVSQAQVLNKILNTKDMSIVNLNNLDANYFFNYKAEFEFIQNHYNQYKCVPDKATFVNSFPDFDFVDVNEPDNYLYNQLMEDYNDNFIATKFNKIRQLIMENKSDDAIIVLKEAYNGVKLTKALSCVNLLSDTSRYDRYLEKTVNPSHYYISTGFSELDKLTGGIDRENENMVIIARTGQGKTYVLLKMAVEAAKQGLTVGIYEGEMTADKVGYRVDTFLSHIENSAINRGNVFVKNRYKEYIDNLKTANYGPIKVFTPNDVSTGVVTVDTLRTFIEREHIDILFVDQYDLLDDKNKARVEFERIANIARDIKYLQVEKQIPIISVSQMNRTKTEDGHQDTTQVAGSDKIPRYATTMIALEQKRDEEESGVSNNPNVKLVLNIIKARDGGDNNKFTYNVNFNTGYFTYIPTELDSTLSNDDFDNYNNSYHEAIQGENVF